MKESSLMRVLFCKIHCPFICFCKPSSAHLYTPGPFQLENTPHVVSLPHHQSEESLEPSGNGNGNGLKSCIRKGPLVGPKRVQWMDNIGKDLVEIKEFESRRLWVRAVKTASCINACETGDTDTEEETRHCLCIIL